MLLLVAMQSFEEKVRVKRRRSGETKEKTCICRRTDKNLVQFKTELGQIKILAIGRIRGEGECERSDAWNDFIFSVNH